MCTIIMAWEADKLSALYFAKNCLVFKGLDSVADRIGFYMTNVVL